MSINREQMGSGQRTVKIYRVYGLLGGAALGLVFGVLISGPQFYHWPVVASLSVISACAAGGALFGWCFLDIIVGGLAGATYAIGDEPKGDGVVGFSDGGSGGGDGGGSS
jgi:hypothetical protein